MYTYLSRELSYIDSNLQYIQIVTIHAIRPYDVRDSLLILPRTVHSRWPDGQMGQLLIDINEFWRDFRARIEILRGVIA